MEEDEREEVQEEESPEGKRARKEEEEELEMEEVKEEAGNLMNLSHAAERRPEGIIMSVEEETWDLTKEEEREELKSRARVAKTIMLVGSPIVGVLRDLGLTGQKIPESMKRDVEAIADRHRETHVAMCRDQARKGLYYLYENRRDARSWMEDEVLALQRDTGAEKVMGKDHTWMTNSKELAKSIRRHEGDWEKGVEGMRVEVVKRLWEATEVQMKRDGRIQEGCIGTVMAVDEVEPGKEEEEEEESWIEQQEGEPLWDDSSGKPLDPKMVKEARDEELRVQETRGVHQGPHE